MIGAPRTLVDLLREAATAAPGAEALVFGETRLDYGGYWRATGAFAAELARLGARGERVAVVLPNGIDIAVASFAAMAAGAQLAPLNPLYTAHELRGILADAEPRILIHDAEARATLAPLADELGIAHRIELGERRLVDLAASDEDPPPPPDPDGLALLQYTGGTSGRSKGVNLTGRALAANVAQREAFLPTNAADRVLVMTPLYHSYATAMGLALAANCRGALVILERFKPDAALEAVARERITLFAGSPAIFNALLAHEGFARADLLSLRLCYSGSAALSEETLRRFEEAAGCPICEGYGQTEAGPILTYNPQNGVRKRGSVGPALPDTEVEVVDLDTGTRALPPGELGEIRARGPQIMSGYRNRPEETAAALRDGWLYTGDIGVFDEDAYLFIRDRKKEMVIVSGFNVYPREVEEALFAHPDVFEAAVVGRPDARRGEALVAFVALRREGADGARERIEAHLAERLTRYKLPGEYRFVQSLPRTAVGKIDKTELKREASSAGRQVA